MSAAPPPYIRQANFLSWETSNPTAPKRGTDLDAEFDAIAESVDQTQVRLAEIQRDDGKLRNESVHPDALSPAVRALLAIGPGDILGDWASGVAYHTRDVVAYSDGNSYIATVDHVATSFPADEAAGKWLALTAGGGAPGGGETNTASNVGLGEGTLFKGKVGTDLQFKTLRAGTGVTITNGTNEVQIDATGVGGGETNTASNLGTGAGQVFAGKTGVDLRFRSIKAGTNMLVTQNGTEITLDVSIPAVGATWGSIGGALSSQTDLQSALNAKADSVHSHTFASITGKPTTLSGYGITDGISVSSLSASSGSASVGYTRTGTGAVTRTVQDRLRDCISVKDYGATGDGVTNDRTAIVNADAAAFAAGKTLFFPAGTYMVSSHIYGLKASWQGEAGVTVKAASGLVLNLEAMLTWVTASDFSIRDMAFDLQSRPITAGSEAVIAMTNCDGFEITHCRVLNLTGTGISINGGRRFLISGNFIGRATASTSFNQAILVSSSSRDSLEGRIFDNRCYRSAINLHMIDGWVCRNYISEWGFGAGITTEQGSTNSLRYRIIDNVIENSGTAIDVNGYRPGGVENWGYYTVIAGNHIANCAGAGIDQGGLYSTVRDNIILNNGTSGADNTPGPQVAGGDGISIRYGNATYNGNYSVVCNNFIADTRAAGDKVQGYGVSMQSASITGVHVYGNRYDGNWLGDENLLGTNGWFQRPLTSGNFKVQTSGAGSWEFACPVTFSGSTSFSSLTTSGAITAGTELVVASGNRVKLQGAANLTGIRYSSPNVELQVGASFAAGFGTNTVGFCGTTPIAKPTISGSKDGNAALASLLTALANMGLITDSTT